MRYAGKQQQQRSCKRVEPSIEVGHWVSSGPRPQARNGKRRAEGEVSWRGMELGATRLIIIPAGTF
jgi:hypothetical protein